MKKILLVSLLAALFCVPASAQETADTVFQKREVVIIDENPVTGTHDTVDYYNDYREIIVPNIQKKKKSSSRHSFKLGGSVGVGYNALVKDLGSLKMPEEADQMTLKAKSINFNLTLFTYNLRITDHFGLRSGFELEVNNFRFDRNISLAHDENGNTVIDDSFDDRDIYLSKSKLVTSYLNIPVVLRVTVGSGKNRFYAQGGVVAGWRWATYLKVKSGSAALKGKHRYHDDYNIRNIHWGYTAGLGFRNYGIYATYYPRPFFRSGKGPADMRHVNIGVNLNF